MASKETKDGRRLVCENRRARHDYAIDRRLEAGLALTGSEVKACREGKAHLSDAYVMVRGGEGFLVNGHIAEYSQANRYNHEPNRDRKLLLHKKELERLEVDTRQKGLVAVPLALYFKEGRVKLEIGVGKGKTEIDRREAIRERDVRREMQRVIKR